MPRIFLGIFCPSLILSNITPLLTELNTIPNCHATEKNQCHITLHFFGEVQHSEIPQIIEKTQSVLNNFTSFPIQIENINTFGYRIMYLEANHQILTQLTQDLATTLGILDHHPKTIPHITIARQKISLNPTNPELLDFLKKYQLTKIGIFTPTKICLIQSNLTDTGSEYKILHEFPLKP